MKSRYLKKLLSNVIFGVTINILLLCMIMLLRFFEVDDIYYEGVVIIFSIQLVIYWMLEKYVWEGKKITVTAPFWGTMLLCLLIETLFLNNLFEQYDNNVLDILKKSLIIWSILGGMYVMQLTIDSKYKIVSCILSILYGALVAVLVNILFWGTLPEDGIYRLSSILSILLQVFVYFVVTRQIGRKKPGIYALGMFVLIPVFSYLKMSNIMDDVVPGFFMDGAGYVVWHCIYMVLWGAILVVHIVVGFCKIVRKNKKL